MQSSNGGQTGLNSGQKSEGRGPNAPVRSPGGGLGVRALRQKPLSLGRRVGTLVAYSHYRSRFYRLGC